MLINIAILLFFLGALIGLIMATQSLRGHHPNPLLATGHGVLVATGLLLLIYAFSMSALAVLQKAGLVVLVVAALGGFFLLSFHVRREHHPFAIVVLHALLAVSGVVLLLVSFFMPAIA